MIKNEEGYADPTYDGAYKTIRQEEKRKQDEADAARMDKAIHKAREISRHVVIAQLGTVMVTKYVQRLCWNG